MTDLDPVCGRRANEVWHGEVRSQTRASVISTAAPDPGLAE